MGCCGSSDGDERSSPDASGGSVTQSAKSKSSESQRFKLLLLGPGDSGKSTFLRQIRQLYGEPLTDEELRESRDFVFESLMESMRLVACNADILAEQGKQTRVADDLEEIRQEVASLNKRQPFTVELFVQFEKLLRDEGIQNTIASGNSFHLMENFAYMCENMHRFYRPEYVPTFDDIVHSRQRTTGVPINTAITIQDHGVAQYFELTDVGGQRRERRKWVTVLKPDVSAIIYVCSLSGYNQQMWEDHRRNQMAEAIALFDTIVNSTEVKLDCDIVVLLNKSDLFEQKLKRFPISSVPTFSDYTGDNTFKDGLEYFRQKFAETRKDASKRIYIHVSCATDTGNVESIFGSVRDILLRRELDEDIM